MFSSIKKLFGTRSQASDNEPVATPPPFPSATAPASPVTPAPRENRSGSGAATSVNPNAVAIPLHTILKRLPAELIERVRQMDVGTAEFVIPTQKVLTQIALGAVKVSFGELRQSSPPGVFTSQADRDRTLIEIPLNEIIARLDPSMLLRRGVQRQVVVPPEVAGPFGHKDKTAAVAVSNNAPIKDAVVAQAVAPIATAPVKPVVQPFVAPLASAAVSNAAKALEKDGEPPVFSRKAAISETPTTITSKVSGNPPAPATPVRSGQSDTAFWGAAASALKAPTPVAQEHPLFQAPAMPQPVAETPVAPVAPEPIAPPAPIPFAVPTSVEAIPRAQIPVTPIVPSAPPQLQAAPETVRFDPSVPPAAPEPAETRYLTLSLSEVAPSWPEEVQREIAAFKLASPMLALPFSKIEIALKHGRIAFPWKIVRSWVRPPVGVNTVANDAVILEFPLKLVTPLFLSELKTAKPGQRKVKIDDSIPDLFTGAASASPSKTEFLARIPASPAVMPAPSAAASVAPELPPVTSVIPPALNSISLPAANPPLPVADKFSIKPKPADTNYFSRPKPVNPPEEAAPPLKAAGTPGTAFLARYATPGEIVNKAAAIEGVEGALIALPDGLLVASNIPPTMNADTIAAFLPQIFGRVQQCTKELRLGELNNLNFTVGHVPWKIFKVGAIYFAAFGSAGESLPTAELVGIAAELDRKPK